MEKKAVNLIEYNTIKRQMSSGFLEIYEAKSKKRSDKNLILFAEIEVSDKDNETIVSELKSELEYQFFNTPAQNDEYAFESALAKANIRIKDILLSKPRNWLNKIHIVTIAICSEEIYIAPVGNMHAFLVHNQKISDVIKSPQYAPAPNPVKLFTNIISGNLGVGNAIIVANEAVLDYLSEDRIKKCTNEYDPKTSIEKISELLLRAPENKQFGVICIKRNYKKEDHIAEKQSIVKIEYKKPEQIAFPSEEKINIFGVVDKIKTKNTAINTAITKIKPYAQAFLAFFLAALLAILEKILKIFKNLPEYAEKLWIFASAVWRNSEARRYHIYKIKQGTIERAKKITKIRLGKRGIVGFGIFIIALLLIISVSIKTRNNKSHEEKIIIQNKIENVNKKISDAEAALIYDNKAGALVLLSEAEKLIQEIQDSDTKSSDEYKQLLNKITNLKNQSENKRIISDLRASITIDPAPINANETGLIKIGEKIIFFDGLAEKISDFDIGNNMLINIPIQNMESFNTAIGFSSKEAIAFKKDSAIIIDIEKEIISKQNFDFNPQNAKRFIGYLNNIYTFDTGKNQIIKYQKTENGFSSAQNWLTQEYELATMKDIAIDGYVYLIDSQGSIHIFLRGKLSKKIPWPLSSTPGNYVRIYTSDGIENIYVLDSGNKRIVKINKNGTLIEQVESDKFENATDIVIGTKEEYLYILAYDKIYKVDMSN